MPSVDEVPVALFFFDRSDCLARVVAALRQVKPKRLFLIGDGPRPGYPDDVEGCRRARAVVEAIDWPADLAWRVAETNLGCDRSFPQGLDWVFDQVGEAIILDDDMLPAADFFPWCAAMLERYRTAPDISHVCGRNELGTWPTGGADHLLVRRGSKWGWATWATAWKEVRVACLAAAARAPVGLHADPLVALHLGFVHDLLRRERVVAWDVAWSLGAALAGKLAVLPPANLIANIGFRPDATHTAFAEDFRGALPTGAVTVAAAGPRPLPDDMFDRWALVVELLAAQRGGTGLRYLAKARHLVRDARLRLHLAPFDRPDEAAAVLRHLAAFGTRSRHLEEILATMELMAENGRREAP
jgi:hypothetical protein